MVQSVCQFLPVEISESRIVKFTGTQGRCVVCYDSNFLVSKSVRVPNIIAYYTAFLTRCSCTAERSEEKRQHQGIDDRGTHGEAA